MANCGSALSVDCCQNNHVSLSAKDILLSVKLAGVVGCFVSFGSLALVVTLFFFSSRRRHTRFSRDWFRRVLFRSCGRSKRGLVYSVRTTLEPLSNESLMIGW